VTHAELDDERAFLLASLEDLERERAAGDIGDADYALLRDRYTRRAAEVLRATGATGATGADIPQSVEAGSPDPNTSEADTPLAAPPAVGSEGERASPSRRVRRRRSLAVVGACALLAAVALAVVAGQTTARLPGQTSAGSVRLSPDEQLRNTLAQAETLEASGHDAAALRLYLQVLARDPGQPEAAAEAPALEFEAGAQAHNSTVLARAQQLEEQAARAHPRDYAPHLYLGSMLLAEADAPGAVDQYREFLSDRPPVDRVVEARPFIVEAFHQAGDPVPALPAG
jgi:hypothetical protein